MLTSALSFERVSSMHFSIVKPGTCPHLAGRHESCDKWPTRPRVSGGEKEAQVELAVSGIQQVRPLAAAA